jgi:hypothetical protein
MDAKLFTRDDARRQLTRRFRLLSRLLGWPLAHFLMHFVRCVTGDAARDSAHEDAVMGQMACNTASECTFDAAFGDGDAWGERNREG